MRYCACYAERVPFRSVPVWLLCEGPSLTSSGLRASGTLIRATSTEGAIVAGNIAEQALAAERLRAAISMRSKGAHWSEISGACGYPSPAAALRAVGEAMAAATMRAEETADMMRDTAQLRLERLLSDAMSMIAPVESERYDAEGNPMGPEDDRAVRLKAVDTAKRLTESIAKIQGVDKPKPGAETAGDDGSDIRIVGVSESEIV